MGSGNGFTRRGLFGAGAAGAAAVGMSACGDDYFEPATSHGEDAPNVLLIFTDSTRADYLGHWNPEGKLNDTPNLDALGKDSLAFKLAVPEAMPTGPARRALLTGVRSFPFRNYVPTKGLPLGPGWIPIQDHQPIVTEVLGEAGVETAYCTDNPFLVGPRFGNFRRTLDFVQAELLAGRLPLPQQALQAPGAAQLDRALPPARAERLGGGGPAALDGRLELDLPRQRPRLPDRSRGAQRHQHRRRPQEEAPVLPGRGLLRPARAARRAARVRGRQGRPQGHREGAGHHPDPAVRDALLVGDRRGARRRDDRARPRALRRRDHASWTSGSVG